MKITIVDYGMGNIRSIIGALKHLGVEEIKVSNSYDDLIKADKLILPGVGSFPEAIQNIKKLSIDKYLKDIVLIQKKPILGICLGMQLLSNSSSEIFFTNGLGFVDGIVSKFIESNFKVPHMGFNQVEIHPNSLLFRGIEDMSDFYFVHSFRMLSNAEINQSICSYSENFIASFEKDNIAGVQFHPELSQNNGLKLLKNFINYF